MRKAERERLNNCVLAYHSGVKNEEEHFYTCLKCGQAVDMRRLGDVFYHDEKEHRPIPVN